MSGGAWAEVPPVAPAGSRIRRVVDWMARIGRPIGVVVAAVVMVPAAVVCALAWVSQRAVGFDLLTPPATRPSRWVRREGADPDAGRPYTSVRVTDPRGARRAAHRLVASALTMALLVAVVVVLVDAARPATTSSAKAAVTAAPQAGPCTAPANPALDGQPGWPQLRCELTSFTKTLAFDAATTYTFGDFAGLGVNERSGARVTWQPPACTCRRWRVWVFGGSAAWGASQRDEFTIASQLAQLAARDGVALEITNFAMLDWTLGQEVRRFAQLTSEQKSPDIALFYDGAADLGRQYARGLEGRGADESETSRAEDQVADVLTNGPFSFGMTDDKRAVARRRSQRVSPVELARHAIARYRRDVELGRRFAAASETQALFAWQPLAVTAPAVASNPGAVRPDDAPALTEMAKTAQASLPAGVVNLSHSLDAVGRPAFTNLCDTNEQAAGVMAAALWARLAPVAARG